MSNAIAIQASAIHFRYPRSEQLALKEVNLEIEEGSCTGLIGPNGAGKSTLISLLTGLLKPLSGEVCYPQQGETKLEQVIQQQVALVPQDFAFYQQLTVRENLTYFAALTRQSKPQQADVVQHALQACQLAQLANKPAKALSGGNKRKLNLAIALLKQPKVIFLDEPTVGVDPISRQAIMELIQQLKEQGRTLIYTSHLLNEVQAICDRVYVMQEGQISQFEAQQQQQLCLTASSLLPEALKAELEQFGSVIKFTQQELIWEPVDGLALHMGLQRLNQHAIQIDTLSYQPHSLAQFYQETFQ